MNINNVSIVKQNNYDSVEVYNAVEKLLDKLGGMSAFIKKGMKVFVKANLVREMPPEAAATTHPAVIEAVCRKIIEAGGIPTVGDSCGGVYTSGHMNSLYKTTGMRDACEKSGASLNQNFSSHTVFNEKGNVLKSVEITDSFLDADVVVNVCKLKTHGLTGYSGAVKNLFGLIPGLVKAEMHSKYNTIETFCNCLIDLERFASEKIVLHVIDGIIGMDGNGPTNGKPKEMDVLIASADPYLADMTALSLFCDPLECPVVRIAGERGICNVNDEYLSEVKKLTAEYAVKDFKKIDAQLPPSYFANMPLFVKKLFRTSMSRKVTIMKKVCVGCGKCKMHCPAKAITIEDRKARIDQSKCIRCYCCQELCPKDAVAFHKPILYGVIRWFSNGKH